MHEDSQIMTAWVLWKLRNNGIKKVLYQGMYSNYTYLNRLYQIIFELLFKKIIQLNANYIIAKTMMAKEYLERKGFQNISVLPIGLDINKEEKGCLHKESLNIFRKQYKKVLLYIGKIEKRRNPRFLIDVLSSLRNENHLNYGLIIVGDGPLMNLITVYSQNNNVKQHILHIRSLPNSEIKEVYKNSDLFLLPSNNEIYGMVVIESLYYGIPVISTSMAGPVDIIQNENLGYCLPLKKKLWVDKIIERLSKNETLLDKEQRKKYIIDNYDLRMVANEYLKILRINENSSN